MMTFYLGKSTVRRWTRIRNKYGTLIDPNTITSEILDPNGTSKTSGTMTKDSEGVYYYDYNLDGTDLPGIWKSVVTSIDESNKKTTTVLEFEARNV